MLSLLHIKPVAFHRYPSRTTERVFSCERDKTTMLLERRLRELFTEAGIKNEPDNKIVFECLVKGVTVCYGFYDIGFSIGLGYHTG